MTNKSFTFTLVVVITIMLECVLGAGTVQGQNALATAKDKMTEYTIAVSTDDLVAKTEANCTKPNGLTLAKNKMTKYTIAVSTDDLVAKTAANELAKYLKAVSGADFPIVDLNDITKRNVIAVGAETAKRLMPDLDLSINKLGDDGIVVKTSGSNLVLTGAEGASRGTLYAVYEFLEQYVGCRWWTFTEEFVPKKDTLHVKYCNIFYTPKISDFHQSYYMDVLNEPTFSAKLKSQGYFGSLMNHPELGGSLKVLPSPAHTYYRLLPPEKYFQEHPEWYSADKDGKRFYERGQLCLTNTEMTDEMIKVVDGILNVNPNCKYIALCPEDRNVRCLCPECQAVEAAEGSQSGPIVRFTNTVANAIALKHPDVKIVLFAYSYYQAPPKVTKCAKNVVINYCTLGSFRWYSVDSDVNKAYLENFLEWKTLNPENTFWIWDYNALFTDYIQILPNYSTAAKNIKYYSENNVQGMFVQGDAYCSVGDFARMRAWIIAHILWNPELDYETLENEFLNGYYGDAAPYLKEYLRMMEDSVTEVKPVLDLAQTTYYLTPEIIGRAADLFAKALNAVKDDNVIYSRVEREEIPLLYAAIVHSIKGEIKIADYPALGCIDEIGAVDELSRRLNLWNVSRITEAGKTSNQLISELKSLCKPMEDIEFNGKNVKYYSNVTLVNDSKASSGVAVKLPIEWYCQYNLFPQLIYDGRYILRVSVRCEVDSSVPPSTNAFTFAIYGAEKILRRTVTAGELINDNEYHSYDLVLDGVENPNFINKDLSYLYICAGTSDINVFFDKMQIAQNTK